MRQLLQTLPPRIKRRNRAAQTTNKQAKTILLAFASVLLRSTARTEQRQADQCCHQQRTHGCDGRDLLLNGRSCNQAANKAPDKHTFSTGVTIRRKSTAIVNTQTKAAFAIVNETT